MNVKDIKPTKATNVTPEVIKAWTAAYPSGISVLEVESGELESVTNDEGKTEKVPVIKYRGWVRKPNRDEMRELTAIAKSSDPVTYTERILDIIWLGGDEEIIKEDEAFYAIMPEVQKVLDIKAAQLKKL